MRSICLISLFLFLSPSLAPAMDAISFDGRGRMRALNFDGELMEIDSDIRVATPNWTHFAGQASWSSRDFKSSTKDGIQEITGHLVLAEGKSCLLKETIRQTTDGARVEYAVTAEADLELDGVSFCFRLPVSLFVGGQARMEPQGNAPVKTAEFPKEKPADPHFLSGPTSSVTLQNRSGDKHIALKMDRTGWVAVQDDRQWKDAMYSTYTRFHQGNMTKGQTATFGVTIALAGSADHSPVTVRVQMGQPLYDFSGFGGSYVYGIDAPVAQYTLKNLPLALSRTQMSLFEWEPTNDNDSPDDINWAFLEAHDKGHLHNEFTMAQQIQQKGIPFVISIWHLPEWMYADPGKSFQEHGRKIAADKWPEVLESIGSYLLYAKRKYGAEPDYFSFNECNSGVMVLFSPEEYHEMVKLVGPHLKKLGLKTKILLSDTAGVERSLKFSEPTSNDAEAMSYVGAVAFHSWGGATPQQYHAWREYADRLKLPLFVTEVGVDAAAWQTPWVMDTFYYAVQELRMYQELLLYAQPQATVQWEYSGDYPLCRTEKDEQGKPKVAPTRRYWFIEQLSKLTPRNARALGTTSSNPAVLVTAFETQNQKPLVVVTHIANLGPSRPATITGLPYAHYSVYFSDERGGSKELGPVNAKDGRVEIKLPALALTTIEPRGIE